MLNKKIMSGVMSAALCASMMVPAFAASTKVNSIGSVSADITNTTKVGQDTTQGEESKYYDPITADNSSACTVYATVTSSFSVVIPKTIILDGTTKTGEYSVDVKGDIAGDETITVTPAASFTMKQDGKADVTANVTQVKASWTVTDLASASTTTGEIEAAGLSAGSWNGAVNFAIALN